MFHLPHVSLSIKCDTVSHLVQVVNEQLKGYFLFANLSGNP